MNLAVLPGETGQVRLIERPMPAPPSGTDVLVRMERAPINPADLLAIDGRYAFELAADLPLGAEGVGVVEAVGQAVETLAPGDMVLPLSRGNWCRYRTVNQSQLIAVPHGIDMAQAAMLRINPPTARLLLQAAGAVPGDVIVQNAATSAVATWVRAIAARMDITLINVVRRSDDRVPDAIVDGEDLTDRVRARAGGRPIVAALDCVAGTATGRMAQCLAPGGRLILFGHLSGAPISVASQLLTGSGLSISGFSLRPAEAAMGGEAICAMFTELLALHAETEPSIAVREVIALSRADEAITLSRAAGVGRIVLDLGR